MQEEEMGTEESNGVLWMLRHYSSVTCMCSHTRTHIVIVIKEPGSWYKRCQSTMQSNAVSKDTLSFHLCFHIHYYLMHQALLPSFTYLMLHFSGRLPPEVIFKSMYLHGKVWTFTLSHSCLYIWTDHFFFPGCSGSVVRFALTGMVIGMET